LAATTDEQSSTSRGTGSGSSISSKTVRVVLHMPMPQIPHIVWTPSAAVVPQRRLSKSYMPSSSQCRSLVVEVRSARHPPPKEYFSRPKPPCSWLPYSKYTLSSLTLRHLLITAMKLPSAGNMYHTSRFFSFALRCRSKHYCQYH